MKYDAFISYRHLPKDLFVAKNIHRTLETAKIPQKIQLETGKKRINRVFRDQEELAIGSDLSENIEAALKESEYLIVICSPQTRESEWVMKEIDTFISLHGRNHILAVLVDGEPEDSFPRQILTDDAGNPVEPLAADVRGNSNREILSKIKSEGIRLVAAILGCDYDDLRQRHRERIMKRNMLIAGIAAVLGISFGIYNAYNLARINENYQQKLINESKVIAKTSGQLLEAGNRRDAALVAMEGLPVNGSDRPFVPQAQYALSEALMSYQLGGEFSADKLLDHTVNVSDFRYYPEQNLLISLDTSHTLYLWNVKDGTLLFELGAGYFDGFPAKIITFGLYKGNVIEVTEKEIISLDIDGNLNYRKRLSDLSYFSKAKISPSGRYIFITDNNSLWVYDSETGENVKELGLAGIEEFSDYIFGSEMAFLSDTVLAIECVSTGHNSKVIEIFWEENKYDYVEVENNYILGLNFTVDGDLVVCSMDRTDFDSYSSAPMYIQKFDDFSSEPVFTATCDYDNSQRNYTANKVLSRKYEADGSHKSELIVNACKSLYVLDMETGKIINKIVPDGEITGLMIDEDSSSLYVGTLNGNYYIMDSETGLSKQNGSDSVEAAIIDMYEDDDILIIRPYMSPELIVKSDIKDDSAVLVDSFDIPKYNADNAVVSPDGSKYVVSRHTAIDSDSNSFKVYYEIFDAMTDEKLDEFTADNAAVGKISFADNDTIVIYNSEVLIYHGISDKKTETLSLTGDSEFSVYDPVFSASGEYLVLYSTTESDIRIVDVKNKNIIASKTLCSPDDYESMPNAIAISNDGTKVYYVNGLAEFYCYDLGKDEVSRILDELTPIGLSLSDDGNYLLLNCTDGFLRVVDTKDYNIADTVEFHGEYGCLMKLSADNTKLFLQGADYLFRVYDLKHKEYVYEAASQNDKILQIFEDRNNNLVIYRDKLSLYLMDMQSFGLLSRFDRGLVYLAKDQSVISSDDTDIYRFRLKSLDDLALEAKNQFGDHELSLRERRMYGLE